MHMHMHMHMHIGASQAALTLEGRSAVRQHQGLQPCAAALCAIRPCKRMRQRLPPHAPRGLSGGARRALARPALELLARVGAHRVAG